MREKIILTIILIVWLTAMFAMAISNWKTGRSEPNLESLKRLARYFDVSIEYFLSDQKKGA